MLTLAQLLQQCAADIHEIMPWDLAERMAVGQAPLLLDVREPDEFAAMHIRGSINVPRGVLESACEYDYDDTCPALVEARLSPVVVVCRSGQRSVLAAYTLKLLGYQQAESLKTGLRGWNDYDQPLVNSHDQAVDADEADAFFTTRLRPEQIHPERR